MMNFLYPAFLSALALLAIPVIIHLFNFRRYKRIFFPNVRFLREVNEQARARSRIRNLIVLLCRMLAFAFIVMAFAQPFIPVNEKTAPAGKKIITVYIDNSFSMSATVDKADLLSLARQKANEIASAYAPEDEFQLLTNDFEGQHMRLLSREEFQSYIEEVEISPVRRKLSEIISVFKIQASRLNMEEPVIFLISDFQKNITDIVSDTTFEMYLVPLSAGAVNNIYIDTCWLLSPVILRQKANQLVVRVNNAGNQPVENARISLKINGKIKAITDIDIGAGSMATDTMSFTVIEPGNYYATLEINDYPVTFDNTYYFAFKIDEGASVLVINQQQENKYINALLAGDDYFKVENRNASGVDYASLATYRLIILNGLANIPSGLASALKSYLREGGSVVVFPAEEVDLISYNAFLRSVNAALMDSPVKAVNRASALNARAAVFRDVFEEIPENILLPEAKYYYPLRSGMQTSEEPLIAFKDGRPMVAHYTYENGHLYLSAVPLNEKLTDLPAHALFVPMLYNMALLADKVSRLSYELGTNTTIEVDVLPRNAEQIFKIKNDQFEYIPRQQVRSSRVLIYVGDELKDAGIYRLFLSGTDFEMPLAFNYNRAESDLSCWTYEELESKYKGEGIHVIESYSRNLTETIKTLEAGISLWKLCLILALVMLAIETLLLRLFP